MQRKNALAGQIFCGVCHRCLPFLGGQWLQAGNARYEEDYG
ncbi:MAG: hypothetical protein UHS32_01705 [Bacteroidaceae bacterium]|nr:hypothetical protein [Bacteroidaceae bacterium]